MRPRPSPLHPRPRGLTLRGLLRRRHLNPWNWCIQAFCLLLLALGLWLHNAALLILAGLGFLASQLDLRLPPMRRVGLGRIEDRVAVMIRREHDWAAGAWSRRKKLQAGGLLAGAVLLGLALWHRDLPVLVLALALFVLVRVALQNKADGIDP